MAKPCWTRVPKIPTFHWPCTAGGAGQGWDLGLRNGDLRIFRPQKCNQHGVAHPHPPIPPRLGPILSELAPKQLLAHNHQNQRGRFWKMWRCEVWPKIDHIERGGGGLRLCGLTNIRKHQPLHGTSEVLWCLFVHFVVIPKEDMGLFATNVAVSPMHKHFPYFFLSGSALRSRQVTGLATSATKKEGVRCTCDLVETLVWHKTQANKNRGAGESQNP